MKQNMLSVFGCAPHALQARGKAITLYNLEMQKRFSRLDPRIQLRVMNQGAGVEIEVEQCPALQVEGWVMENDNSLRNIGREFKTQFGQRVSQVSQSLFSLIQEFKRVRDGVRAGLFDFTERTSVHVHLDARNMTVDEVVSLLSVYTIFEEALFSYAGEHRTDNVFCIPLRYTPMNFQKGENLWSLYEGWSKYAALNILPLRNFGTLEFRHMPGNADYPRIMNWVLLLALLTDYCKRTPRKEIQKRITQLKVESNYQSLLDDVFQTFSELLPQAAPEKMDQAVSDAKTFFIVGSEQPQPKKKKFTVDFNQLIQAQQGAQVGDIVEMALANDWGDGRALDPEQQRILDRDNLRIRLEAQLHDRYRDQGLLPPENAEPEEWDIFWRGFDEELDIALERGEL